MAIKLFAVAAFLIASLTIWAGYTQQSALLLRQETQPFYWRRHNTSLSGRYRNNVWVETPNRSSYGTFRGGGPSVGK